MQEGIRWNYTSVLNIVFLAISAVTLLRFLRTGGPAMLKMMDDNTPPSDDTPKHHCCH